MPLGAEAVFRGNETRAEPLLGHAGFEKHAAGWVDLPGAVLVAFDAVEVDFFGGVGAAVDRAFVDAVVGGVVAVQHGAAAGRVGLDQAVLQIVAVDVAGIAGHVAIVVIGGIGG